MKDIKTINLQGKEYVPVHERIRVFRSTDMYNGWGINTRVIKMTDTSVVIKSLIVNNEGKIVSSGHGAGTFKIDKGFEKVETVSVGRALANLGIGIEDGIASIEEMVKFLESK